MGKGCLLQRYDTILSFGVGMVFMAGWSCYCFAYGGGVLEGMETYIGRHGWRILLALGDP